MLSDVPGPKGGKALKRAIHAARPHKGYTTDMALSMAAGVSYDTLMNWYGDKTVPRPAEVKKVGDALGVPYGDLLAAYEGRDPTPPALHEAIAELVAAIRADVDETRELRQEIRELARAVGSR